MKKLLFMLSAVVFAAFATSCQKEVDLSAESTPIQTVGSGEKLQQNTKTAFETLEKFKTAPATGSTREALDFLFPVLRKFPFNIDFSTMPEYVSVKTDISKLYGNYTYNNLFVYEIPSDNDSTISLIYNKDLLTTYQFEIFREEGSTTTELPFKFFNLNVNAEFDNSYVIRIKKDDVLVSELYLAGSYTNQLHALMYGVYLLIYDENDTTTPDWEKEPIMNVNLFNAYAAGTSASTFGIIDSETDASFTCSISTPNRVPERASTESVNNWLFNYATTLIGEIFRGELLSIPLHGELCFNVDESVISFDIDNIKTLMKLLGNSSYSPERLAQILNENITASCELGDIYFALDSADMLDAFVDVQEGEDIPLLIYLIIYFKETFFDNE